VGAPACAPPGEPDCGLELPFRDTGSLPREYRIQGILIAGLPR